MFNDQLGLRVPKFENSTDATLSLRTSTLICANRDDLGLAAGKRAEQLLVDLLCGQESVRVVFAAAPSQNEMLAYLRASSIIDWSRVSAFHMDEYVGLPQDSTQSFGHYLRANIFEKVSFKNVNFLDGNADPIVECERYSKLLDAAPIDLVLMGVGENGHIAFNDPPVADFDDPLTVKQVELDEACRVQQVNDGCFAKFEDVPTYALTLTIPTLMSARALVCSVPGSTKSAAVGNMFLGPVDVKCPASVLRLHPQCYCFFDAESAVDLL